MSIPARPNEDADLLMSQLLHRFETQQSKIEELERKINDEWIADTFTNRPKLLERVIVRRESKSGKINYEIAYTVYDDDDDLIWDIKNKYLGSVTHFKRFNLPLKDNK